MHLPITLSRDSKEPIYHQIENQLKALIAGGSLPAGTLLPSIRKLSKQLEVSVITTRRAYQNLEIHGYIETEQGKGTFVAEVDQHLKAEVKKASVLQVFHDAIDTALQYDYTLEEIEEIFQKILEEKHRKENNE
ncbi:GntR family transcriptional regulator [Cerasibacillus terrae]|uniref:GntR family transcriptional regulator n=1 Tax=Cerasibacillus terrae TaxID=2498845 RepID=A0A5C8NZ32_9BACI|nr:GntR family transcriptional regulator [Cerasibacillus terrae]TXL66540.1 GntR family transcriptional regulator [Cerasibacillus terrae]